MPALASIPINVGNLPASFPKEIDMENTDTILQTKFSELFDKTKINGLPFYTIGITETTNNKKHHYHIYDGAGIQKELITHALGEENDPTAEQIFAAAAKVQNEPKSFRDPLTKLPIKNIYWFALSCFFKKEEKPFFVNINFREVDPQLAALHASDHFVFEGKKENRELASESGHLSKEIAHLLSRSKQEGAKEVSRKIFSELEHNSFSPWHSPRGEFSRSNSISYSETPLRSPRSLFYRSGSMDFDDEPFLRDLQRFRLEKGDVKEETKKSG